MNELLDKIKSRFGTRITDIFEKNQRRVYLNIDAGDIREAAGYLYGDLALRFIIASGTDTPFGIEILYHFSDDRTGVVYSLRVLLADKNNAEIDSLTPLFQGAFWIEREIHELLGVNFRGHGPLHHLLLPDDWPENNYPLRHDHE